MKPLLKIIFTLAASVLTVVAGLLLLWLLQLLLHGFSDAGVFSTWILIALVCAFTFLIWLRLFRSPKKLALVAVGIGLASFGAIHAYDKISYMGYMRNEIKEQLAIVLSDQSALDTDPDDERLRKVVPSESMRILNTLAAKTASEHHTAIEDVSFYISHPGSRPLANIRCTKLQGPDGFYTETRQSYSNSGWDGMDTRNSLVDIPAASTNWRAMSSSYDLKYLKINTGDAEHFISVSGDIEIELAKSIIFHFSQWIKDHHQDPNNFLTSVQRIEYLGKETSVRIYVSCSKKHSSKYITFDVSDNKFKYRGFGRVIY